MLKKVPTASTVGVIQEMKDLQTTVLLHGRYL